MIQEIRKEEKYKHVCVIFEFMELSEIRFLPSGKIDRTELQERADNIYGFTEGNYFNKDFTYFSIEN